MQASLYEDVTGVEMAAAQKSATPEWVRTLFTFVLLSRNPNSMTPGQQEWVDQVAARLQKMKVPQLPPELLTAAQRLSSRVLGKPTANAREWIPFATAFVVNIDPATAKDLVQLAVLGGLGGLLSSPAWIPFAAAIAPNIAEGIRHVAGKTKQLLTGVEPLSDEDRLDRKQLAALKNLMSEAEKSLKGELTSRRARDVADDPESQKRVQEDIRSYESKIARRDAERDRGRYRIFGGPKKPVGSSDGRKNCGTGAGGFQPGNTCGRRGE